MCIWQTYKQAKARSDIIALAVAPGWVKTGKSLSVCDVVIIAEYEIDMGGPDAPLEPLQAVAGMLKTIKDATSEESGKFIDWDGTEIPW